jgi:hypothetical protein
MHRRTIVFSLLAAAITLLCVSDSKAFVVSGTLLNKSGMMMTSGPTVTLTGTITLSVNCMGGYFNFPTVPSGNYTITATMAGWKFSTVTLSVIDSDVNCVIMGTEDSNITYPGNIWKVNTRANKVIRSLSSQSDFPLKTATGDINGDGRIDLLASGDGNVYLFFNQTLLSALTVISTAAADAVFMGLPGTNFGTEICSGDVDLDGKDDILISAPYAMGSGGTGAHCGEVYLFYGKYIMPGGRYTASMRNIQINGLYPNDQIGSDGLAICNLVDTPNPDKVISAPNAGDASGYPARGELYIFNGALLDGVYSTASNYYCLLHGTVANDRFGAVFPPENIFDTSRKELLCSAKGGDGSGRVYALNGESFANLTGPGANMAADIVAGIVVFGTITGENTSFAFTGDLDRDGKKDLIVGSPGFNSASLMETGKVCVYRGQRFSQLDGKIVNPINAQMFDLQITGVSNYARCSFGFGADLNNDNSEELIVSGVTADADGISRGEIYGFLGQNLSASGLVKPAFSADFTIQGNIDMMRLTCLEARDINNNGLRDLIISQSRLAQSKAPGAVYIIFDPIMNNIGISINGRVTDSYVPATNDITAGSTLRGVPNAKVTFVPVQGAVSVGYTDANGYYTILALTPGMGTLTPLKYNWSFVPASKDVYVLDTGISNVDFTGTYNAAAQPKEISVPIGTDGSNVNVTLPEAGGLKILAPEAQKDRKGTIDPTRSDEVAIVFKGSENADTYVGRAFKIRIFNLLGELVDEFEKIPQTQDDTWMKWIPKNISSGIYVISVKGPEGSGINFTKKIPIIR